MLMRLVNISIISDTITTKYFPETFLVCVENECLSSPAPPDIISCPFALPL